MLTAADLPDGLTLNKVDEWYDRFRFYRVPPSREDLVAWINQFAQADLAVATKLLDRTVLISDQNIQQGFCNALNGVGGWALDEAQRVGQWAFVGLGGQAESGAAMLHMFREANGLTQQKFQKLFVTLAELPRMRLTARDTVIFVDDFSGTGDQFSGHWDTYRELVSSEARTYLFLAAATAGALARLQALDDIEVRAETVLPSEANILAEENTDFAEHEKAVVLSYCKKADGRRPRGWGNCGLLLVISRKTPNNSLPILHVDKKSWRGVFPRQLRLQAAPVAAAS